MDHDQTAGMGPVDYLCVEFPRGSLKGTAMPLLLDLVDRRVIRILDMVFLRKSQDGTTVVLDARELDENGMGAFHGAASGILDPADMQEAAGVLEPGSAAALLIYENLWAAPLATALRRNGAQLVARGGIPAPELLAALDASESRAATAASGR